MNAFDFLKKKDYQKVVEIGCFYAKDINGFKKFAETYWTIGNGDYVRAVVATAQMLNENYSNIQHDLHVLDFIFENALQDGNALINPISKFFDDENGTLMKEYQLCLDEYHEINNLHSQLQTIELSCLIPLIKSVNYYKLMNYNNKNVIISAVQDGDQIKRGIYKIKIYGKNPRGLKVRFGGNILPLVGIDKGVVSIQDPDSYELLFQNLYVDSEKYSDLQKTGFIFGVDDARKYYAHKVQSMYDRENKPKRMPTELINDNNVDADLNAYN